MPSEAIGGHQRPSEAIKGQKRSFGHKRPYKALENHQRSFRPLKVIEGPYFVLYSDIIFSNMSNCFLTLENSFNFFSTVFIS